MRRRFAYMCPCNVKVYKVTIASNPFEVLLDNGVIFGMERTSMTVARTYIKNGTDANITVHWRRASIYDGSSEGTSGGQAGTTLAPNEIQLVDDTVYVQSNDNAIIYLDIDGATDFMYRIETWISGFGVQSRAIITKLIYEQI